MVQALYIADNSIYKQLLGEGNCWDKHRDATTYAGAEPVIAHPPCQDWCNLSHLNKENPERKRLAIVAVEQVRRCGGILEHPKMSRLWEYAGLPLPGKTKDEYGGWTACVNQIDFGHVARKSTWLYIVRCQPIAPPPPSNKKGVLLWNSPKIMKNGSRCMTPDGKTYRVCTQTKVSEIKKDCDEYQKKMTLAELRNHTPIEFAQWLISMAN